MPDAFVPPITGAPQRTRAFFNRVADEARRASLKRFKIGPTSSGSSVARFCRVQQVGGTAGNDSTDCTFTYDMFELDDATLINASGGPVTPKNGVDAKVTYTAATYALWQIDRDNTFILFVLDELPATEDCAT